MIKTNPVHYKPMWVLARIGDEFDLSAVPDSVTVSDAELIAVGMILEAGLKAMENNEDAPRLHTRAASAARAFYEKLQMQFAEEFYDSLNTLDCFNQRITTESD